MPWREKACHDPMVGMVDHRRCSWLRSISSCRVLLHLEDLAVHDMTSPDERFDDAYLDREVPQHHLYDPVRHEYRIGIGVWPAVCFHCGGFEGPKVKLHVCDMAVVDWIWIGHSGKDNAATLERARERAYTIQILTEEEAAGLAVVRPRSQLDFWNWDFNAP